jgi:nucleotide-binding universal stress UspA family protein
MNSNSVPDRDDRPVGSVVVGIDGSESAVRATRWAVDECRRRGARLELVSCVAASSASGGPAVNRSIAAHALDRARAAAHGSDAALAVSVELKTGWPVPIFGELSGRAVLIALGSLGVHGFADSSVGGTAIGVAMVSKCPVVVVRGASEMAPLPNAGPVIVGIDGSPASTLNLGLAFQEASLRRARLRVVLAWTADSPRSELAADQPRRSSGAAGLDQERFLSEALAGWQQGFPDVHVERMVMRGPAEGELRRATAGAQLLVVGNHGHSAVDGLLAGATCRAMIYHASCPLMIAPIPVVALTEPDRRTDASMNVG